jgi:thiol-disulfide isomerase/thioredoxin
VTRRTRIAITIGVLAVIQLAAVAIYFAVERSRTAAPGPRFAAERLSDPDPAPTIAGVRADGSTVTLAWPARGARLVHFWGTWCEPCRKELPSLLAFARDMRERGVEVVAIAVDDDWKDIATFFDGKVPSEIVVETSGAVHKRFGVSTLPDTYLVDQAGKLVERYHGARDWQADAAREHVLGRIR